MPKLEEVPGLTIVDEVLPGKHSMEVMSAVGDTKYMWDPAAEHEVTAAKETFNKLRAKGYHAFRLSGKNGDKGELMREFDPAAGAVIMCPQIRGGR